MTSEPIISVCSLTEQPHDALYLFSHPTSMKIYHAAQIVSF